MTMNPAQRAALELAQKNGLTPMEQSAEFMLHDLTQACLNILRTQKKVFSDLGEQQQDALIREISDKLKKTVYLAADILLGAEVVRVPMLLQDFKAAKDMKLTGIIESDHPGRFALMDKAHEKAKVTILIQDMDYFAGMSNIQADKDQKSLALDPGAEGGAAQAAAGKKEESPRVTDPKPKAKNPPKIPAKTLEQAREFIIIQQNGTLAGLQNFLKCDITKARAIHALLQEEGLLTSPVNDREDRNLVRAGEGQQDQQDQQAGQPGGDVQKFDGFEDLNTEAKEIPVVQGNSHGPKAELTDDIYAEIMVLVIQRQSASLSTITTTLGVTDEVASDALDRLEMEGVVSEEDDLGGRSVLMQECN